MFTVDSKEDRNGTPFVTEINIRHVSFTHAFSLGGANFANETLEVFHRKKPFQTKRFHFNKNYHFIRGVDHDLFLIEEEELKS